MPEQVALPYLTPAKHLTSYEPELEEVKLSRNEDILSSYLELVTQYKTCQSNSNAKSDWLLFLGDRYGEAR